MKKVILAKITQEEMNRLQNANSITNTLKTLSENQFLDEKAKEKIASRLSESIKILNEVYKEITNKYKIPYLAKNNYRLSTEKNEIYVEVYD